MGGFTDRQSYERYLRGNTRFRARIEPALEGLSIGPWRPRRLLPLLRLDMTDLGLHEPESEATETFSGSALAGLAYVLEGAALGGAILRKQAATLGLSADFGARHLSGDASSWAAFVQLLETMTPYDEERAVEGAKAAFGLARVSFAKEYA